MTFDLNGSGHPAGEHTTAASQDLHACPECGSAFVYPRSIEEHGAVAWELQFHCPECGWTDIGVFDQPVVQEFIEELERGRNKLESDLAELVQANMADYVDRFSVALAADAIHPMDF